MRIFKEYYHDIDGDEEIPSVLANATAHEVYTHCKDFYEYFDVGDSIWREKAFQFAASELNIDYNEIYYKWLGKKEKKVA